MPTASRQPVSIIVPTLNEVDNLDNLFSRIHHTMERAAIPFEIIIIDDHSTDGTLAHAQAADPKYNVRALTKEGEAGKAFSLLEGFEAASFELLCMIDGDLQYPPEAIAAMYTKLEKANADVVVTHRIDNQTSPLRRLSTATFNLIFTKALFGIDYDTQSGLKLFKKRVLRNITITPSAWSFDLEFIVKSLEQNYRIVSHDIAFTERTAGEAKINMLSATFELASASVRLHRNTATKRVKHNFKKLESLQSNAAWKVVALTALSSGLLLAAPVPTNALSLNDVLTLPGKLLTPSTPEATNQTVTPTVVQATTPTLTTATTTQPTTVDTSVSNSQSAATPAPTSTSASNTPTTNSSSISSTPTKTTPASTSSVANAAPSTTRASDLSTSTGKAKPYYVSKSLGNAATARYLHYALMIISLGAALIGLAVILALARLASERFRRQTVRA